MNLQFIGTGSAFTVDPHNFQSNMLIFEDQGPRLLIDCGSDARRALHELGLSYRDIHSVYISHLHGDHVGGLEWLGFSNRYDLRCQPIHLYVNEFLVQDLWDHVLSGGMGHLQEGDGSLDYFFKVHRLGPADNQTHLQDIATKPGFFEWGGIRFEQVETIHVNDGVYITPSFGLFFEVKGLKVFLTTDTQFTPEHLEPYFKSADLIFHDCEILKHKTGVHAHYDDLLLLDPRIKKKMWLYHYNPGLLPDARADGFLGFVSCGQIFELHSI